MKRVYSEIRTEEHELGFITVPFEIIQANVKISIHVSHHRGKQKVVREKGEIIVC